MLSVVSIRPIAAIIAAIAMLELATTEQASAYIPEPIWAKAAVGIEDGQCSAIHPPQIVPALDGESVAELLCGRPTADGDYQSILRIKRAASRWQKFNLRFGASELLWSPDSKSVLINGGENAYTNYIEVYRLESSRWHKLGIAKYAQRDMVRSFPPCKALNHNDTDCRHVVPNMAGIAWSANSSALIVMSEIPCSSIYGGIMCQVQGYEVGVPDGRIIRRMTARQLKARWQNSMNWEMRIPDSPVFQPASQNH